MTTKSKEVEILEVVRDALEVQEILQGRVEKEEDEVAKQKQRSIPDYAEYEPSCYAQEEKNAQIKKKEECVRFIKKCFVRVRVFGALLVAIIAASIFEENPVFAENPDFVIAFFLVPIYLFLGGVVGYILLKLGFWEDNENKVLHWTQVIFCFIAIGTSYMLQDDVMIIVSAMNAVVWGMVGSIVTCVSCRVVLARRSEKEIAALVAADRKDEEDYDRYLAQKAEAEIKISQQREELAAEVAKLVAACEERVVEYKKKILVIEYWLDSLVLPAKQDRSLYTVNTILEYFERGKAHSYKEAINLFDAEERQKEAVRAIEYAAIEREKTIWRIEQDLKDANEEWLSNQRRHHEHIENETHKMHEFLENEINRLEERYT